MSELRKLKRVVIKEELVALTGKVDHAIVLNQFIFWSERVKDVDQYLKEEVERERKFSDGSTETVEDIKENLTNGWIYKTAAEMKEECMFEKSTTTVERIMQSLVENGWLERRRNPKYKWDKTWQYRVNIMKIQRDLMKLGYSLEGYNLPNISNDDSMVKNEGSNLQNADSKLQNEDSNLQNADSKLQNEDSNLQNADSKLQNEDSKLQNADSNLQNAVAIPEITTETTNIDLISSSSSSDEVNLKKMAVEEIDNMLREKYNHIPQEEFEEIKFEVLTDERAIVKTIKQYQGLFEYRLKEWKPKNKKENNSVKQAKNKYRSKKQGRSEIIPEWFEKYKRESEEREKKAKEVLDKAVGLEGKEDSIDFEEERKKVLMKLGIIEA